MRDRLFDRIKNHPAVREVFAEHGNLRDGRTDWWVHLRPGWQSDPETHSIHSYTLTECLAALRKILPCQCESCQGALEDERKPVLPYSKENSE